MFARQQPQVEPKAPTIYCPNPADATRVKIRLLKQADECLLCAEAAEQDAALNAEAAAIMRHAAAKFKAAAAALD